MNRWKLIGIIATALTVIAIPLSVVKYHYRAAPARSGSAAAFVGSEKCRTCHQPEYELWRGSNHYHAMSVADEASVRGDFNDATFERFGIVSRFYRRDGKFMVHTQGPDGVMGEFEVTHTFGWNPLQQYLVPFPGGRMQCLPIAWDVNARRWYHLYPDQPINPKDWLYWTNAAQNWNGMCATCHSTRLQKNYDVKTDTYRTTWSDINVGCEACHGPGSRHVKWAELPDMARPPVQNYDLAVRTSKLKSREAVELCAPCHSRRAILGDYTHIEPDLLDTMLPSLLTRDLYFADGQILEEVYAYGSFTQSKMYARDVRCSDCHNVHSIKRVKEGNSLCLQCHRADDYDTRQHHFHKTKDEKGDPIKSADGRVLFAVGTGAECTQCHMPGRYYMGVHYRLDHSLRIPRPDLSLKIGVPNACNRCHVDKTVRWADETITKWYGPGRRPHYGEVIQAGRNRQAGAEKGLVRLAGDALYPVIVRATALELLQDYPGEAGAAGLERALTDGEALIRRTAADHVPAADPQRHVRLLAPLLYDPVKAVRIEAASRLAGPPSRLLAEDQRRVFEQVLKEYIAAMEYSGDFAFGRLNLGNLYVALGQPQKAIENFRAAIKIDDLFYPAKVNLAMLYSELGRNSESETLLREVVKGYPELYDAHYSLGLLLAEEKKYVEAEVHLSLAARGLPDQPRVQYNLGLLYDYLRKDQQAEVALSRAVELEPDNMDYLQALAQFYLKRDNLSAAGKIADRMIARHPGDRKGIELRGFVQRKMHGGN
ncbi:MAG: tetratricopeptide repeat protein [Hyphomicrobiales bacterium]